jgi:hypothetical protein
LHCTRTHTAQPTALRCVSQLIEAGRPLYLYYHVANDAWVIATELNTLVCAANVCVCVCGECVCVCVCVCVRGCGECVCVCVCVFFLGR